MNDKKPNVIVSKLKETYPDAQCSLDFTTPFELVVAVMMSAQCTDERVNQITKILFQRCPTLEDYVTIPLEELEEIIKPCGFFKAKASNIKKSASIVLNNFNSIVPNNPTDLNTLAGIRKKKY